VFPVWLAPIQVAIVTVTDRVNDHARHVMARLAAAGARVSFDDDNGTMQAMVRDASMQKIPYTIVIGDKEVASDEVERLIGLVQRVYGDFGLPYTAKLSTRPPEFLGEIATWDHAEAQLKAALDRSGLVYELNAGDGAFYGPKIDFDITDAIGRKWQCATIQLDYQQPENFDLKYVGADNTEHRPVVIHRAIVGSFERFIALLIEHYAGAFPLWLAPVQVVVVPIADRHLPYAETVRAQLAAAGLRVELDGRQEKIGSKIREAQLQKVPYMLVAGDREAADGTVSVRSRAGGDQGARRVDEFVAAATDEIRRRGLADSGTR
jgi:threonyl-tRNA synthetase